MKNVSAKTVFVDELGEPLSKLFQKKFTFDLDEHQQPVVQCTEEGLEKEMFYLAPSEYKVVYTEPCSSTEETFFNRAILEWMKRIMVLVREKIEEKKKCGQRRSRITTKRQHWLNRNWKRFTRTQYWSASTPENSNGYAPVNHHFDLVWNYKEKINGVPNHSRIKLVELDDEVQPLVLSYKGLYFPVEKVEYVISLKQQCDIAEEAVRNFYKSLK